MTSSEYDDSDIEINIDDDDSSEESEVDDEVYEDMPEKKLPYKCTYCEERFERTCDRTRHTLQFHETEGRNEVCVICNAHFSKKSQLRCHVSVVHKKHPIDSKTSSEAIAAILNSCPYKCDEEGCEMAFPTEQKMLKHKAKHQDKRYICAYDGCGCSFAFRKEMQEHIKDLHMLKEYVCCLCQQEYSTIGTLRDHMRLHQQQREKNKLKNNIHDEEDEDRTEEVAQPHLFRCEYEGCDRVYTRKGNLNMHVKSIHLNKTFDCDLCEQKYKNKTNLKRHYIAVHKKEYEDAPKLRASKRKRTVEQYQEDYKIRRRKDGKSKLLKKILGPITNSK
ncbi:transcription factor IIIA [Acrasis kona]|uniref:Transcription factor IIIA n=1 Tax=Acrasis kona TaxID=1008807 RepID=A0AAW2ZM77_9EUKA